MSNSSLVDYTKLSPNCYKPRKYKIEKITIHHVAGVASVETLGNIFATTSRKASCNYGIGSDGRIALIVDEANGSWCSSNYDNDNRAITIEVSNSAVGGEWPVSDHVLSRLIDLCTDICERNDIKRLNYTGDKSGNLTMHCWFAATACPGPYLKSKYQYIADEVNKRLGASSLPGTPSTGSEADEKKLWDYMMQVFNNPYGVAGLMGNLRAESGLRSNNMENSYESKLGYNDTTYTAAVDDGSYTNFVNDAVGYGLAQFTFHGLKQDLLDYAKMKKKSIGDFEMQMEFLAQLFEHQYPEVFNDLKNASNVFDAAYSVLVKFERPARQDEAVQNKRAKFGEEYYNKYVNRTSSVLRFNVGDIVNFNGGLVYRSANADTGSNAKATRAKVTSVFAAGEHQYHCRAVNEKGAFISGLYGWVDAADLSSISTDNTKFALGDEVKLVDGATYSNGKPIPTWVFKKTLYVRAISGNRITISTLRTGAITGIVHADNLVAITAESAPSVKVEETFKVGEKVELVNGATYYNGQSIATWVFSKVLYVRAINGDNITISTLQSGAITGVVNKKYLIKY
jgi:hypothetical protein